MVDPVIDEHFRRSLGADYMNLFGKRLDQLKSTSSATTATATIRKSPPTSPVRSAPIARVKETLAQDKTSSSIRNRDKKEEATEDIEMSVDDHFAKALGDTWKQLQQKSNTSTTDADHESDNNSEPENDSNLNGDCSLSSPSKVDSKKDSEHSDSHSQR